MQLNKFSNQGNLNFWMNLTHLFYQCFPGCPIRLSPGIQTSSFEQVITHTSFFQYQWYFVQYWCGDHRNYGFFLYITEEGNLIAQFLTHWIIRTRHNDIWSYTD